MNTPEYLAKEECPAKTPSLMGGVAAPWQLLITRIRSALHVRDFYVASLQDLSVLWREERIDAVERRRRIAFFAALNHWQVETRSDGRTARFHGVSGRSPVPGELLSRNPE